MPVKTFSLTTCKQRLTLFGAIALAFCCAERAGFAQATTNDSGLAFAAAIESSMEAAIAKAEKSVVAIARVRRDRYANQLQGSDLRLIPFGNYGQPSSDPTDPDFVPAEFGTGIVFDAAGLILTTCDVLGDLEDHVNSKFYVTAHDRKIREATIEAADPRSNLAVLKVSGEGLVPITFGDGGKLRKGQIVIALGNPYAIARDGQASASWGIVSNLQRKAGAVPTSSGDPVPSGKTTLHHLGTLIQTDAKLNLGTSGGALLNLKGEMVGLTTSLAAAAGYEQAAGYAIPVDETFRRVLDELRNGRAVQYGFLGVAPNLTADARRAVPYGVLVQEVVQGAPAAVSGIQSGDVITHIDGQPVIDFDNLMLRVGSQPAGQQVELSLERQGRVMPVKLTLAKFRNSAKAIATKQDPAWRGVRVDYWTAVLDIRLDRNLAQEIEDGGCVIVTEVTPDSPAAKAGLKPNMAVTHVEGARVGTPKDFNAAVRSLSGPVSLRITSLTDEAPQEIVIPTE